MRLVQSSLYSTGENGGGFVAVPPLPPSATNYVGVLGSPHASSVLLAPRRWVTNRPIQTDPLDTL